MTTKILIDADLQAQRDYAAKHQKQSLGLVVTDAFIRGIRDIGYKSTATALDEEIDNSIQAGASYIHVVLDIDRNPAKPSSIAVIDDGHGMDPEMIRLAVMWGGTHRENDRSGFGRYGYGLPSSCVSQGKRFTVYSMVEGGRLYSVTVDLEDLARGKYTDEHGSITVPDATPAQLPRWVEKYIKNTIKRPWTHGTVVLLEELDKLTWKSTTHLQRNLVEHFGVTYRNILRKVDIWVQGEPVQEVDPLFTTPGARFYDLDEDRAVPYPDLRIEVKGDKGPEGVITVRFAYMPPTFLRVPEDKHKTSGGRNNARFHIRRENTGLIVLRNGRQIDVVPRGGWLTYTNNDDRYWGVEINFTATLDEEFSITTSKQQVALSERIWDILKKEGVHKAIRELRSRYDEDTAKLRDEPEISNGKRASEQAMEAAEDFKSRKPGGDSVERQKENDERLNQEARRRARETGRPVDEVKRDLEGETRERPYRVVLESMPGAPFFRVVQIGGQKQICINTAHRFYTHLYASPDATPRLRSGLEVLLFVIGDCELDASGTRRLFYESERGEWSKMLNVALAGLDEINDIASDVSPGRRGEDDIVETSQTTGLAEAA